MKIIQECLSCGERLAKYTCKLCGRPICEYCFNKISQTCKDCATKK